jgi:extradiol dioxygenase family protein
MNLSDYSDFEAVLSKAKQFYGENVILKKSTRKTKKYMIFDPYNNKFIHFGQI